MSDMLRVLLLEDSATDAELNERILRKAGLEFTALRVETEPEFTAALAEFKPDILLADYHLPQFDGLSALAIVSEKYPDIPFIFVTGALGEERAVDSIKLGATDYIIKDRLTRLPLAVQRALEEKALRLQRRESEEKFRKITESAQDAIIMMGADQRISFWNRAAERIFGYAVDEVIGQKLHDLIVPEAARRRFMQGFPHFQDCGEGPIIGRVQELAALRKGGEEFPVEISVAATQLSGRWHAIGIVRDITERKKALAELQHSEASLKEAQQLTRLGSWELDLVSNQLIWSDEIYRIFEIDPARFGASYDAFLAAVHPDDRNLVNQSYSDSIRNRQPYNIVHRLLMQDGRVKYVHEICATSYDDSGKPLRSAGTVQDITERKRAEIALSHANRALATLSAVNRQLVHADEEEVLLQSICQAIVEQRGYRLASVGYALHDADKSIRIMAYAGHNEGYLESIELSWAETDAGMGPSGRAIRSGATQLCQDIANDPRYRLWRDAALQRGFAASIALPLADRNGMVFGILAVYAEEVNAFSAAEVDLLEEMAGDLAFGVLTLRIRHERDLAMEQNHRHLKQLQDSLEDTVLAIASIVEMRDPYTSGHQARVADLAVAIARKLSLPDATVHAIHLAGVVHDLGKIQIPSEILSKPGKLSDIEYSLIKIHPQAGHEVLKGISFPWPIAQMVLQHHERIDGSGYPHGLKGDDILLEARIIAVADVVEAMTTHRPYRPSVGIAAALAEIERGKGSCYDLAVVEACIEVVKENGMKLP